MKALLIAGSAIQVESLRLIVEAEGYDVANSIQRQTHDTLKALINNLNADVLIVECSAETQAEDIATLEILNATNANVLVLMLSQARDTDTLLAAMQAGVREVLLSPPNAADLKAVLRRLAQKSKYQQSRYAREDYRLHVLQRRKWGHIFSHQFC